MSSVICQLDSNEESCSTESEILEIYHFEKSNWSNQMRRDEAIQKFISWSGLINILMDMLDIKCVFKLTRVCKTLRDTILRTPWCNFNHIYLSPYWWETSADLKGYMQGMSHIDSQVPLNTFCFSFDLKIKYIFQHEIETLNKFMSVWAIRGKGKLWNLKITDFWLTEFLSNWDIYQSSIIYNKDSEYHESRFGNYIKDLVKCNEDDVTVYNPIQSLSIGMINLSSNPFMDAILESKSIKSFWLFINNTENYKSIDPQRYKRFISEIEVIRIYYPDTLAYRGKELNFLLKNLPNSLRVIELNNTNSVKWYKSSTSKHVKMSYFPPDNFNATKMRIYEVADLPFNLKQMSLISSWSDSIWYLSINIKFINLNTLRNSFEHTSFPKLRLLKLWKGIHINGEIIVRILKIAPSLEELTIDCATISDKSLDWILKHWGNLRILILWRWRGYQSKAFVKSLMSIEENNELYRNWVLNKTYGYLLFSESNIFQKHDKLFIFQNFRFPWRILWSKTISKSISV